MTDIKNLKLENLKKQIQELFPNKKVDFENEGWTSYAFTVGNKIVRIPKAGMSSYIKESAILGFLKDKFSVEIPETEVVTGDDLSYAIHKKLEGKSWDINTYNKLSLQAQNLFCFDIATFYAEMHKIPIDKIPSTIGNLVDERYLEKSEMKQYLKPLFSEIEINKLCLWFEENIKSNRDLILCHQDFHHCNSLVDENHRLKGVFDFGNAGIADRCWEFSSLYWPDHMGILTGIIKHYEEIMQVKIDMQKIDNLDYNRSLSIIWYLSVAPNVKKEKEDVWHRHVENLRKLIIN
ncbi:MAG: aminoglycoside phosphotransferase family protein [Proteobacteria bacterium]|nr:aminoglycoside phosphotransferase family protein [Pseudomonadota bacterium]